ncbi:unnamed protein product [Acanthoscelides obtectus]|uniref:SAP domain-containing protein n=1 Tax=Acanthoscelides obtectus TaxID=200917 RepID=A0A9P0K9B0_ACAOB|nr:unnamed protein product [Acanthoscelides obtectus]CAK1658234.1 Protein DEK [Acanthoscelides obtectus]
MSSEGDSSKSVLSEANEKSGTDNNTDDSQDSQDVGDAKAEKPVKENNVDDKKIDAKDEEEKKESDAKPNDIKKDDENDEPDAKPEVDEKVNNEAKTEAKSEDEDAESEGTEKSEKEEPEKNDKVEKKKKEKKEKVEEKSEGSENEEESDEEKSEKSEKDVPLLDQPLEISGKRERKNVQRFKEDLPAKSEGKVEFAEGKGTALGDIPRIEASITRYKNDDLKTLHRLLFKVNGKTTLVKKNIRKFNGFDFDKDSDEYQKKIASVQKLDLKQLKGLCEVLDLQKSGTKDDLVNRIVDFLLEPKDSGKPVDGGRPRRSAAVKANNRGENITFFVLYMNCWKIRFSCSLCFFSLLFVV